MVYNFGGILLFFLFFPFFSFSQEKKLNCEGTIKGVIIDSAYNFLMPSATISLYKSQDSSLLHYTISDDLGTFNFSSLHCNTPMYIVITYLGYHSIVKNIVISEDNKTVDLKKLPMYRKEEGEELKEVIVTAIPPIRMNGDTLEFNADAFKLDSNAVVEDLIRRLPGLTVWGDGDITFNGRKIHQIMVEGKPFFGGNTRLATQNLPKKSVDKIQVYSDVNLANPLDSLTSINIKLKEGNKSGIFGKISSGYGTEKRFELDGSLNHFSPKTQLSLFGSLNNTNKVANDINTLLLNHTYKGISHNLDWHSNFKIPGINTNSFWGGKYQKDFLAIPDSKNKHRLNIEYLHKGNNNKILSDIKTKTILDSTQNYLIKHNQNTTEEAINVNNLNVAYENNNNGTERFIKSNFSTSKAENNNNINQNLSYNEEQVSKNEETNISSNTNKKIMIEAGFSNQNKIFEMSDKSALKTFKLKYALDYINSEKNLNKKSSFTNIPNNLLDKQFERLYEVTETGINHDIQLNYNKLKELLFGYRNIFIDKFDFNNQLTIENLVQDNKIGDIKNSEYKINSSMTNKNNYNVINYQPAIEFSKSIESSLFGRYIKSWNFALGLKGHFYNQNNASNNNDLDFNNSHKTFLPSLSLKYSNVQIGRFSQSFSLSYLTNVLYPQLTQMTAIADSSMVYNMHIGNISLKKQYNRTLSLTYRYALNNNIENDFVTNIALSIGNSNNKISDSTIYDNAGRSILYFANVDGYKFLQGNIDISRSFKIKNNNTLQLKLASLNNASINPNYIDNILYAYNTFYNKSDVTAFFGFRDFWMMYIKQSFYYFSSKQKDAANNTFTNQILSTELNFTINLSKRLSYGSHIGFNQSTTSFTSPINYTILNMNVSYRFMRNNQAEIKFSALDLLRQNKGIINYGNNNNSTIGTQNILNNFYMLSVAYYPRFFNKK